MKRPSKISIALAYIDAHPEATVYAAAKHAKLNPSPLYAHLKRHKAKTAGVCSQCGQKTEKATP